MKCTCQIFRTYLNLLLIGFYLIYSTSNGMLSKLVEASSNYEKMAHYATQSAQSENTPLEVANSFYFFSYCPPFLPYPLLGH